MALAPFILLIPLFLAFSESPPFLTFSPDSLYIIGSALLIMMMSFLYECGCIHKFKFQVFVYFVVDCHCSCGDVNNHVLAPDRELRTDQSTDTPKTTCEPMSFIGNTYRNIGVPASFMSTGHKLELLE